MVAEPNWARFYEAMMPLGPQLLTGIPSEWVSWLQEEGRSSDMLLSDDTGPCLEELWAQSKELAVQGELDCYLDAVNRALSEWPFNDGGGRQARSDSETGRDWNVCRPTRHSSSVSGCPSSHSCCRDQMIIVHRPLVTELQAGASMSACWSAAASPLSSRADEQMRSDGTMYGATYIGGRPFLPEA